jgi:hypothetical protein
MSAETIVRSTQQQALVRADVGGRAMGMNRSARVSMTSADESLRANRIASAARELVHHAQHPELPILPRPVLDAVVGPDVIGVLRP